MMRLTELVRPAAGWVCVLAVWCVTGTEADAKPRRICVDVQIKSYRNLTRTRKRAVKKKVTAAQPKKRPAPRPRPRPRHRPGATSKQPRPTGATSSGGTTASPGTSTTQPGTSRSRSVGKTWVNPFGKKRYRSGYRAGYRKASEVWRAYVHRQLRKRATQAARYPYPPAAYLRRLVEHYVTHAKGYLAVQDGCSERITIEMYPVKGGWTVFARNSKRAREEKVDLVEYGELPRFAERVVTALLKGIDISTTADLRTILKADSIRKYRTIKGSHHFTFTLGTAFKVGKLQTFENGGVSRKVRALAPLTFSIGYRGRFNAWGLDLYTRGGVGLQRESALRNTGGGHVDLDGLWSIGLSFLRYHSPHGMMSVYYGAGALFDLTVFSAIKPESERGAKDRDRLTGGGLNLQLVLGVEFMRASPAQFFLQAVISAPVYLFQMATEYTHINAYIPEFSATVGIMF